MIYELRIYTVKPGAIGDRAASTVSRHSPGLGRDQRAGGGVTQGHSPQMVGLTIAYL
jgi:hypothetical protein